MENEDASLQLKIMNVESSRMAMETIVKNDYQLQYIQTSLHGYQLNVLTLSSEVKKLRNEVC